jgi:hypothetical protein
MLNLYVLSMKILATFFLLIAALQAAPAISSPVSGQFLRGKVDVTGRTDIPNFVSAQLDFGYASDPADNWFTIQTFSQPVADGVLTTWDTTFISDGDYNLRLRILLQDGTFQDVTVTDLHIRNYTTDTPTPILETPTEIQPSSFPTPMLLDTSDPPTALPRATPTSLPANPASVSEEEIYVSLKRGALVVLILFLFFGLVTRFRRS